MKLKKISRCWTVDDKLHGSDVYGMFYLLGKKHGKTIVKDDIIVSFRFGTAHGHRRFAFPKEISTFVNGRASGISYKEIIRLT